MKRNRSWLLGRAVAALLLTVGFYVLSLGLIALLIYLPYLALTEMSHIPLRLILACLAGAYLIAAAILPRWDRFQPPGALLGPAEQPRFFEVLRLTAEAADQAMPAEVYLVPEVNAFVAQRGGIMGLGSKRVLGVGLPLLQILSVSEWQAVLAHEFGHYHAGDTALGPWIYRLRASIGRVIASTTAAGSWLQVPYQAYGRLFLRVTQAISRTQEYAADALAARIAGPQPMATALRKVYAGALALPAYYDNEYFPVLARALRPPLAAGFAMFVQASRVAEMTDKALQRALTQEEDSPYASHPPIRQRIAAMEGLGAESPNEDSLPAVDLLDKLDELEARLIDFMAQDQEGSDKLRPTLWSEMVELNYIPRFREAVKTAAVVVAGLTAADLPALAANPTAASHRLDTSIDERKPPEMSDADFHLQLIAPVVGAALALAMVEAGWTMDTAPGEPFHLRKDGMDILAFEVLPGLYAGTLTEAAWAERCAEAGIGALALAPATLGHQDG